MIWNMQNIEIQQKGILDGATVGGKQTENSDHSSYLHTGVPKQFLVDRKKTKKLSIPHEPWRSVGFENSSH